MPNKFATALKPEKGPAVAPAPALSTRTTPEAPSRKGAKHIGGYFDPQVSKQLRQIALNEDSSVQALLAEAINMLFHARQMPTIVERSNQ